MAHAARAFFYYLIPGGLLGRRRFFEIRRKDRRFADRSAYRCVCDFRWHFRSADIPILLPGVLSGAPVISASRNCGDRFPAKAKLGRTIRNAAVDELERGDDPRRREMEAGRFPRCLFFTPNL